MNHFRRRTSSAQEPPRVGAASVDAEPDPVEVARTIALGKLSAAPQSRASLADEMVAKNMPAYAIEKVLDRFTEVGLIDDAAYAEMFVRSRHHDRGLARRALAEELRGKGIESEVAAAALEMVQPEDERDRATELVRRKVRSMHALEPQKRRRRLVSMLARKGYGAEIAFSVVDAVLSEGRALAARAATEPARQPTGQPGQGRINHDEDHRSDEQRL